MILWHLNGRSIEVKCPKCGRWGKLVSRGRKKLSGKVMLMVKHRLGCASFEHCCIGICSEHYDELLRIYERCRRVNRLAK